MSTDAANIAGPAPEQFAGSTVSRTLKRLFHATRPKFYPASLLPVLAGSAWGYKVAGHFDVLVFGLALFATLCVHAGANVLNDVGDDSGGTDRQNDDRIYPYTGGSRFIQSGIMSASSMAGWGMSLLALAAIVNIRYSGNHCTYMTGCALNLIKKCLTCQDICIIFVPARRYF